MADSNDLRTVADIIADFEMNPMLFVAIPVNRELRRQRILCRIVNSLLSWLDVRFRIDVIQK